MDARASVREGLAVDAWTPGDLEASCRGPLARGLKARLASKSRSPLKRVTLVWVTPPWLALVNPQLHFSDGSNAVISPLMVVVTHAA